jgi:hypothetical protein
MKAIRVSWIFDNAPQCNSEETFLLAPWGALSGKDLPDVYKPLAGYLVRQEGKHVLVEYGDFRLKLELLQEAKP